MVEDIEYFGAKLKSQSFVQAKVAPHGKIELINRKPAQEVSRQGALAILNRRPKRTNLWPRITRDYDNLVVESPATRSLRIVNVERYSLDEIRQKR